jgi:hypothetical protein
MARQADGISMVREERSGKRLFRSSAAAPGIALGALVLVIGTFMNWVSGPNTAVDGEGISPQGFALQDGRVILGLGFALLIVATCMWLTRRIDSWFDANLLVVALSTVCVVVIATRWAQLTQDNTGLSPDVGLYVALAGALIAWLTGLAGMFASRSDRISEESGRVGERRAA